LTNGRIACCLDPVDLSVSKACAAREKDPGFNPALLSHGAVRLDEVLARAEQLQAAARRPAPGVKRLPGTGAAVPLRSPSTGRYRTQRPHQSVFKSIAGGPLGEKGAFEFPVLSLSSAFLKRRAGHPS